MQQDPLPAFAKLTVYVVDVNDNPPMISVNALTQRDRRQRHGEQDGRNDDVITGNGNGRGDDYAIVPENAPRGLIAFLAGVLVYGINW